MAKYAAKLTRLRSALKKMNSMGKLRRTSSGDSSSSDDSNSFRGGAAAMMAGPPMVTVFVGKCRRRYEIRAEMVEHPVLRQLAAGRSEEGMMIVGCEVVLFEHLLWMLENAGVDDGADQSLDCDLVDLYTCS